MRGMNHRLCQVALLAAGLCMSGMAAEPPWWERPTDDKVPNIVPPEAELSGQARSLDEAKLEEQITAMRGAMEEAAVAFGGRVEYEENRFYFAYRLEDDNPALQLADTAIRGAGLRPRHVATGGGSDAHEFIAKGIDSACLGVGFADVHSVKESMPHDQLRKLTEVTAQLILNA